MHFSCSSIRRYLLAITLSLTALMVLLMLQNQVYKRYSVGATEPTIAGCQLFPANNVWNYNISALPKHPNSANYIGYFARNKLRPYFSTGSGNGFPGTPFIVVPSTQPMVTVHFDPYASESDSGPYPIPANAPIEDYGTSGSDQHVLVLQSGSCKLYEMYSSSPNADGNWKAQIGAIFNLNSNALRTEGWSSADAAGLPILPGLVRYDEVASGHITHALRFLLPYTQKAHIWPARHNDGATTNPNAPPEGLRVRLKANFDISSYPPQSKIILQALKQFGMFLADQSGDTGLVDIGGVPDPRWNTTDLANLGNLRFSDFEALDETGLIVDPNSAQVKDCMPSCG
jgi:hypothetical protein